MSKDLVLVTGAGGFIGGHLVRTLLDEGFKVRAVDIKPFHRWYQLHDGVENIEGDCSKLDVCMAITKDVADVYNLSADMGGMGFIENNKALCMLTVLINTHLLMGAKENGCKRFFFASSACVYAGYKQKDPNITGLAEEDAYPADAEDGYGWEKLFSERMCRHFMEDFGLHCRVARFHNVYGPQGTYAGGREKAPAAMCRKVVDAITSGKSDIEIWGDGHQTRSFMYIDDCTKGIRMIMDSNIEYPINLGSAEKVSINELLSVVEDIADVKLNRNYKLDAPKGVNGRNSINTLIQKELGWEPSIPLRDGMEKTYVWIKDQMDRGINPDKFD
ncbi:MAG: NAD-dependent epimerase/dehydratase family protein [Chthonomonas sp.]|nr:NAD-dependent epimerase/dehydratase family protein [Chthonomonas sp.]